LQSAIVAMPRESAGCPPAGGQCDSRGLGGNDRFSVAADGWQPGNQFVRQICITISRKGLYKPGATKLPSMSCNGG
jgi:hypothetical protein